MTFSRDAGLDDVGVLFLARGGRLSTCVRATSCQSTSSSSETGFLDGLHFKLGAHVGRFLMLPDQYSPSTLPTRGGGGAELLGVISRHADDDGALEG